MKKVKYDAIVVFPFGKGMGKQSMNVALIRRAIRESKEHGVPLVMHEMLSDLYGKRNLRVIMFGGDTICAYARNVKEDMAREVWRDVSVIAATPIVDRCIRDLQRVYPGRGTFHELEDLRKSTPYEFWFLENGRRCMKLRAGARFIWERFLHFVPWPIYRWFSLWAW